ncbi:Mov34/MPN/PAD-1 family protein [Pollutimonas sp. H1-120]|uniref:Mov34/MPN/PAD-1 family protein n=1 Tax=Pollutimonas sp. H1-120 TaxID=3148824 RepID=UPI003B522493
MPGQRKRMFSKGLHCIGLWHSHPEPVPSPSASRSDKSESMKQKVNGTHNIVVQLSETAYGVL